MSPVLSIVVPIYNEEANLPLLHDRLHAAARQITEDYEVIFVNDGSRDGSLDILRGMAQQDARNFYLSFTRNFGHQVAVMAGINQSRGGATVTIDGDLQDPPELIPQLWEQYRQGCKVVYAQRKKRPGEKRLRNLAIKIFYRILKRTTRINIPVDTGDFRLMDRAVVDALKQMPEQHKFLRGQIAWVGYRQAPVYYDRDARYAGKSNYGIGKLIRLALDGFTAFSNVPLRVATVSGFIVSGISFGLILYAIFAKLIQKNLISGWTSLMVSTMFIGGVQLISIGIIGEYISRINSDVRRRPLYIVEEQVTAETTEPAGRP
ncbi:glycosyltransferase [Flaviaesturariibacter flavus]|uniref:Glycosyltransferase n=1 Tax=Flaviaesturariibacter flavus TaxID=2502780 RepID=A0A4R1BNQ6_9BACT|nr:glycosyltransferase family 2 protein [Flaviaesturariibacter flavus]TCJ19184.1 glycosyltransferase [Flaviaesturariibacter flavus]